MEGVLKESGVQSSSDINIRPSDRDFSIAHFTASRLSRDLYKKDVLADVVRIPEESASRVQTDSEDFNAPKASSSCLREDIFLQHQKFC